MHHHNNISFIFNNQIRIHYRVTDPNNSTTENDIHQVFYSLDEILNNTHKV